MEAVTGAVELLPVREGCAPGNGFSPGCAAVPGGKSVGLAPPVRPSAWVEGREGCDAGCGDTLSPSPVLAGLAAMGVASASGTFGGDGVASTKGGSEASTGGGSAGTVSALSGVSVGARRNTASNLDAAASRWPAGAGTGRPSGRACAAAGGVAGELDAVEGRFKRGCTDVSGNTSPTGALWPVFVTRCLRPCGHALESRLQFKDPR